MDIATAAVVVTIKIMNRHPPFGNQLKEAVALLPHYELNINQVNRKIFFYKLLICFFNAGQWCDPNEE